MFNFRKSKHGQKDLTSLNLHSPAVASRPQDSSASSAENPKPLFPSPAHDPLFQAEINRQTIELARSGKHPEAIFLLVHPVTRVPISVGVTNPPSKSVLLFSCAATARFFRQDKTLSEDLIGVGFDQFTRVAEELCALGFDSFVMDLSPKSATSNVLRPENKLITGEQLIFAWAVVRTVRNFQAQRSLAPLFFNNPEFGSPEGLKKLRRALEILRNAGGYEVPFVHWMIALIAGIQQDEPARLAATADLEAFGPDFVARTFSVGNENGIAEWGRTWIQAQMGLLTEFGMITGGDGKPVDSVLRNVNIMPGRPFPD